MMQTGMCKDWSVQKMIQWSVTHRSTPDNLIIRRLRAFIRLEITGTEIGVSKIV